VSGIEASGRAVRIAPPGDCATRGLRLRVPWTEGMLRSLVLRTPPGVAEAAIGDWICHAPRFAAHAFREVTIAWTEPWVERATGVEGVTESAFVRWRCDPPGAVERVLGSREHRE
jgi:hypothetical protein